MCFWSSVLKPVHLPDIGIFDGTLKERDKIQDIDQPVTTEQAWSVCKNYMRVNGVFEVKLCWSRLMNANTSKPGGGIPIYKPYRCVPLILKGKGFSVLVAHPHPASHRVPPPSTSHTWRQTPDTMYQHRSFRFTASTGDVMKMTSPVNKKLGCLLEQRH